MPQWPDNRLIVPVEGTGYLDLLEYWRRDQEAKQRAAGVKVPDYAPEYWERPDNGRHPVTDPRQPGMPGQPLTSPAGPPVPPETGSPFSNPPGPAATAPGGVSAPAGARVPRAFGPGGASGPGGRQPSRDLGPGAVPVIPPASGPGGVPLKPPASGPGGVGPQASTARRPSGLNDTSGQVVIRLQDGGENPMASQKYPDQTTGKQRVVTNPGTNAHDLTPITLSSGATTVLKRKIPPPRAGSSFTSVQAQGNPGATDQALSRAAYQGNATPAQPAQRAGSGMRTETLPMATPTQNQPAPGSPGPIPGQPVPASPPQDRPPAAAPSNILDREIANEPPPLDQKQLLDAGHMNQAEAAELGPILVPTFALMADTEGYGYPKGSRVYKSICSRCSTSPS